MKPCHQKAYLVGQAINARRRSERLRARLTEMTVSELTETLAEMEFARSNDLLMLSEQNDSAEKSLWERLKARLPITRRVRS